MELERVVPVRGRCSSFFSQRTRSSPRAVYVDEALADGVEDGLGAVVDVELLVDVGDVVSDGLLGDA